LSAWAQSPLVVGHRGGRGAGWPAENTVAAFDRARAEGARAIELDVRTCAGGEVVVFHDATLERMTGGRDGRRIEEVPVEDLRTIDLGGGAAVPTLASVLGWARLHAIAVNVEMKHDVPSRVALARGTLRAVRALGADVLLSSFDPRMLALAAALAPSVPRALLTQGQQPRVVRVLQAAARAPLVKALHLERTQADAIAGAVARGLRVGVWTVNDPDEARELVRLGAASIITDAPGRIGAALSRT
jgi:glycerophosphoryl diester phosphodiesterase